MLYHDIAFKQLMSFGVHIGHTKDNTLINAAWMISSFRQEIAIINLWNTLYVLKATFFFLSNIVAYLGPIWFLNFNPLVQKYVKLCASLCGEFAVTTKWIRGAVSNFWVAFRSYRVLAQVSENVLLSKYKKFKSFLSNWHFSRFSWPRALFISNLEDAAFAAREASSLRIPSFGVVDTNIHSQVVSMPIPGNDESTLSLVLYNDLISNYILSRKFSMVLMWFLNVRSVTRIVSFTDWVKSFYKMTNKKVANIAKTLQILPTSTLDNFSKGASVFFSRNFSSGQFYEHLQYTSKALVIKDVSPAYNFILRSRRFLHKVLRINFVKKALALKRNGIKRRFLTDFFFQDKILKRSFFITRFIFSKFILGRVKSKRIKLAPGTLRRRYSFFNKLAGFFFFNKYKRMNVRRAYRRYYMNKPRKYNFIARVMRTIVSRYGVSKSTSLFGMRTSQKKQANRVTSFIKLLDLMEISLKRRIRSGLARSKRYDTFMRSSEMRTSFSRKLSGALRFDRSLKFAIAIPGLVRKMKNAFRARYIMKSNTSRRRLKFRVSNVVFGTYLKYNLLWNLNNFIFGKNAVNYLVVPFFFRGTTRLQMPRLNIVDKHYIMHYEGFVARKMRKKLHKFMYEKNGKIVLNWLWR